MKKIFALMSLFAISSLVALGAAPDGTWTVEGTGISPKQVTLHVSGASLSGAMDGIAIASTGVAGDYFWFHVTRNGTYYTYKGHIKSGKMELREQSPQSSRTLVFDKVQ